MRKSIIGLSISIGLAILGLGQTAFAGQFNTIRTGPNGNSAVTNRNYSGNGTQTTTRTGPKGNSAVTKINRTYSNGQLNTNRTGPNGNTVTTNRFFHK
jgi:hypothetical protein